MDFGKILGPIFILIFIGIIYSIIFIALRVMYSDVKSGDKKRILKKSLGLEVVEVGKNRELKKGSIIPIRQDITIGRKDDNILVLSEEYISGHHAKIYIKNTEYYVEDLNSTNGTYLNDGKLHGRSLLKAGDEIRIGNVIFRVIG
jgi:pSer/pThr/pTyr-binding forkhead associated (FHA) protein